MSRQRLLGIGLEVALLLVLAGTWFASWLSVRGALEQLPGGNRAYLLAIYSTDSRTWLALALGVVAIIAVALRHRHAFLAFCAAAVAVLVFELFFPLFASSQLSSKLVLAITAFWALWRTTRFVGVAVLALLVASIAPLRNWEVQQLLADTNVTAFPRSAFFGLLATWLAFIAAVVAGAWLIRRYEAQRLELAERNEELEQQRTATAAAAVLDERVRIARELHDVVAHHVSTMTVHAGAARQVIGQNPEAVTDALHQIERSGRGAINELQRLLRFLRNDEPDHADRSPVPSLRHLDRLVEQSSGLEIKLNVNGELHRIPPSVDVSAYRIVQEALTNAVKHSTTAKADVSIDAHADHVDLRVNNPGPARAGRVGTDGHGLLGMRERAALHAGHVEAGPDGRGGWAVEACLPYAGSLSEKGPSA